MPYFCFFKTKKIRERVFSKREIKIIIAGSLSDNLVLKGWAAQSLADLASEDLMVFAMEKLGAIPCLIRLVAHVAPEIYRPSAKAIVRFAASYSGSFLGEQFMKVLGNLLSTKDDELAEDVGRFLKHYTANKDACNAIVKSKLLPKVIGLCEYPKLPTSLLAANSLRAISIHSEFHEAILKKGTKWFVDRSVRLDFNYQFEIIGTIANLIVSGSNELKNEFVQDGVLAVLFKHMRSSSAHMKQAVETAIYHLALNENLKHVIIREGGIIVLIFLATSGDSTMQSWAIAGLADFAKKSDENKASIVEMEGIPILRECLTSGVIKTRRDSCRAISQVSILESCRSALGKYNVISAIADCIKLRDLKCQDPIIKTISNLSTVDVCLDQIKTYVTVEVIVNLGNGMDDMNANQAEICKTLGNIVTYDISEGDKVVEAQGNKYLLKISINSQNETTQYEAVRAYANIADCENKREQLVKDDLDAFIGMGFKCKADGKIPQEFCRCLANLAVCKAVQNEMVQRKALIPLMHFCQRGLVGAQHQGMRAIANLAENTANQVEMIDKGILPVVTKMLSMDNIKIQIEAARAIVFFSANKSNKARLLKTKVLNQLLSMAKTTQSLDLKQYLDLGICNLTMGDDFSNVEFEGMHADILMSGVNSSSIVHQRWALKVLGDLMNNNLKNQEKIVAAVGWPKILDFAKSDDVEILREIARCLEHLTTNNKENQTIIVEKGGLDSITEMAKSNDRKVQQKAEIVLCNLAFNDENRARILQAGGTRALIAIARVAKSTPLQLWAATCLSDFADKGETFCTEITSQSGLFPLLKLSSPQIDQSVRFQTTRCFARLSTIKEAQRQMKEEEVLVSTLSLIDEWFCSRSTDTDASLFNMIKTFSHLSENDLNKLDIGEESYLSLILRLLNGSLPHDSYLDVLRCVVNISTSYENLQKICAAKITSYLIGIISSPDEVVTDLVRMALGNIGEDESNRKEMYDEGYIPLMLFLSPLESPIIKKWVISIFLNLAKSRPTRLSVCKKNIFDVVMRLLHHDHLDIVLLCVEFFTQVAEEPVIQEWVGAVDLFPMLHKLLLESDESTSTNMATLVTKFCKFTNNQTFWMTTDTVSWFLAKLVENNKTLIGFSMEIFYLFMFEAHHLPFIARSGLLDVIKSNLAQYPIHIQRELCRFMRIISTHVENRPLFMEADMFELLVVLSSHSDFVIQGESNLTFFILARNADFQEYLRQTNSYRAIMSVIRGTYIQKHRLPLTEEFEIKEYSSILVDKTVATYYTINSTEFDIVYVLEASLLTVVPIQYKYFPLLTSNQYADSDFIQVMHYWSIDLLADMANLAQNMEKTLESGDYEYIRWIFHDYPQDERKNAAFRLFSNLSLNETNTVSILADDSFSIIVSHMRENSHEHHRRSILQELLTRIASFVCNREQLIRDGWFPCTLR